MSFNPFNPLGIDPIGGALGNAFGFGGGGGGPRRDPIDNPDARTGHRSFGMPGGGGAPPQYGAQMMGGPPPQFGMPGAGPAAMPGGPGGFDPQMAMQGGPPGMPQFRRPGMGARPQQRPFWPGGGMPGGGMPGGPGAGPGGQGGQVTLGGGGGKYDPKMEYDRKVRDATGDLGRGNISGNTTRLRQMRANKWGG